MQLNPQAPIGIFDSGIGGLTVANAIHQVLPKEKLIYFGDTAHLPYGEKSSAAIRSYALRISDFLLEKDCKAIVIACNTASAAAFEVVRDHLEGKCLVFDVINPVANAVSHDFREGNIGVIATKATIRTDAYAKRINALNPDLKVHSLATPLLVPMIEEGFYNNNISKTIIASYLGKPKLKNIDALILACTHFPLIRPEIEAYYQGRVRIVDSAEIVAAEVFERIKEAGLLNKGEQANHEFYVSDYTHSFAESTRFFFKGEIQLLPYNLWD